MVEDNVRALAVENELKKFGVFSDKYALKLDGICNLNQEEKIGPSNGEWCRWDCDQNILLAKADNHEYSNNTVVITYIIDKRYHFTTATTHT